MNTGSWAIVVIIGLVLLWLIIKTNSKGGLKKPLIRLTSPRQIHHSSNEFYTRTLHRVNELRNGFYSVHQ